MRARAPACARQRGKWRRILCRCMKLCSRVDARDDQANTVIAQVVFLFVRSLCGRPLHKTELEKTYSMTVHVHVEEAIYSLPVCYVLVLCARMC